MIGGLLLENYLTLKIIEYLVASLGKGYVWSTPSTSYFLVSLLSFLWFNPPFTFSSFTFSKKVSDGMQAVQFTKEPYTALGQPMGFGYKCL